MKNKLQKIIKHIKMMFYNLSLCVSLKKDSTNVEKNEKNSKFVDNFDYNYYMENKEKIDKINELSELAENLRTHVLTYNEFNNLTKLLEDLNVFRNDDLLNLLKDVGYDNLDNLYEKISNYSILSNVDKSKTSKIIGTISGATISTQVKFINEYKKSKRDE